MNKTKEEVLQPHISTYQSDNGESDFDFIWPENASKAMDEYTTHLTDQIKSMENYISDVDGQVKELREERVAWGDMLEFSNWVEENKYKYNGVWYEVCNENYPESDPLNTTMICETTDQLLTIFKNRVK